ncbi:MAG: hypothetical protein AB7N53_12705 [Candidatus Binatia bacterium]
MSKAFAKDDDWDEPIGAPRVPSPVSVPNRVAPRVSRCCVPS